MNILKKNLYPVIFFLVLAIHFLCSINFIDKVYQECDSDQLHQMIENYPHSIISYMSWSYSPNSTGQFFKNLRLHHLESVSEVELPRYLRSVLTLAWASTYSPGVGLIYGIVTNDNGSFQSFMANTILVTIVLAHLSTILLYLIFRALSYKDIVKYSLPLLFIFSSSVYSYQFHLGNTIWNICTGIIFLYYFVKCEISDVPQKKKDLYLSMVSALLLFFNYLIVLYWLTYIMIQLIGIKSSQHKLSRLGELFVSNISFLICLLLILIYFYQPHQGYRGSLLDGNFFAGLYYIVLNFTSVYNDSKILDFLQFSLTSTLLLIGFSISIFNVFNTNIPIRGISLFALIFIAIFVGFVLFRMLSIAPSRHILFLLPIIYLLLANCLNLINVKNTYYYFMAPIWILSLFIFMSYRNDQLQFNSQPLSSLKNINSYTAIFVKECSTNIFHSQTLSKMRVLDADSKKRLESGKYLYLSQVRDFSLADFVKNIEGNESWINFYYFPIIKIEMGHRFLPYNPFSYDHNRPNNFYAYEIDIVY
jgi:hypothetical protein